jgi:hypothetical protein
MRRAAIVPLPGLLLGLLLGVALSPGPASAQSKVGTTVGQFLGIEPSGRSAGMGNAGVALTGAIEGVYFNPGTIGDLDRPSVQVTHSNWFAGISFDYAAVALPIGRLGTAFASLTALGSGDIEVRTVDQPLGTGELYTVGDVAVGLGYGRRVTARFSTGIRVNYVHERIWHTTLDTTTFDLGTLYRLGDSGVVIGSSLSNVGTRSRFTGRDLAIQYDANEDTNGDNSTLPAEQFTDRFPVPILFRVGIGVPFGLAGGKQGLLLVDALHPNDNEESVNSGIEWSLGEALDLRIGYQGMFQKDSELGLTLGAGFRGEIGERSYRIDYGWGNHDHLDETHRLTLVLAL